MDRGIATRAGLWMDFDDPDGQMQSDWRLLDHWASVCSLDGRVGFHQLVEERTRALVGSSHFRHVYSTLTRELLSRGRLAEDQVDEVALAALVDRDGHLSGKPSPRSARQARHAREEGRMATPVVIGNARLLAAAVQVSEIRNAWLEAKVEGKPMVELLGLEPIDPDGRSLRIAAVESVRQQLLDL
jgi:hypothetical protein